MSALGGHSNPGKIYSHPRGLYKVLHKLYFIQDISSGWSRAKMYNDVMQGAELAWFRHESSRLPCADVQAQDQRVTVVQGHHEVGLLQGHLDQCDPCHLGWSRLLGNWMGLNLDHVLIRSRH